MACSSPGSLKHRSISECRGRSASMKKPPRLILVIRLARKKSLVVQSTWISTLYLGSRSSNAMVVALPPGAKPRCAAGYHQLVTDSTHEVAVSITYAIWTARLRDGQSEVGPTGALAPGAL